MSKAYKFSPLESATGAAAVNDFRWEPLLLRCDVVTADSKERRLKGVLSTSSQNFSNASMSSKPFPVPDEPDVACPCTRLVAVEPPVETVNCVGVKVAADSPEACVSGMTM